MGSVRQLSFFTLAVVHFISVIEGAATPAKCEPGWVANGIFCYYFNNGDNRTYAHAIDECEVMQSQVLRIESMDELNFLKKLFQGFPSPEYWTALNQLNPDGDGGTGTWLWGNDEYPDKELIKWDTEPDNSDDEDCGAINIQSTFSDQQCSAKFAYICESDLTDAGCPENWLQGVQDCFYVSNFTDPSQFLTWQDAKKACSQLNFFGDASIYKHLLTFDIAGDTDFLTKTIPFWQKTTTLFWTGLNDIENEGTWTWVSNVPVDPNLIKWTQEPNNLAGREQCAVITQEGTFSDRDCKMAYNFVCRKPQNFKTDTSDLGCGEWTRAGHKCYKFYSTPESSWADARTACQKLNGDLMKLESKDEAKYLGMLSETPKMSKDSYWIGLNDQANEGTFVWADGSKADSSLLTWNHSPKNVMGDEDCAGITRDAVLVDYPCKDFQLGYICEKLMDDNENCPANWQLFNYNCYYVSTELADQVTATSICGRQQGQLLAINDADELQFISSQVANFDTWPTQWWIGLSDQVIEGIWVNPHENDNYPGVDTLVPWSQEPNSYGGNEDCVNVIYSGMLNDIRCDAQIGFICERPSSGLKISMEKWLLAMCALVYYITNKISYS